MLLVVSLQWMCFILAVLYLGVGVGSCIIVGGGGESEISNGSCVIAEDVFQEFVVAVMSWLEINFSQW